uniref:Reverse transcriptase domain-containing protein n=1 Tax=Physcomitrium patens TaxID=3218 RepID=A0A7I4BLA2_PHYPA
MADCAKGYFCNLSTTQGCPKGCELVHSIVWSKISSKLSPTMNSNLTNSFSKDETNHVDGYNYKVFAKTSARRVHPMLNDIIRPHQTGFLKGRSIIDNIFLAFKTMEWAIESAQPMVMLLLDFEKAYNRYGSNGPLYIDAWSSMGLNELISDPFKLSHLVRQGCLLPSFLYLFIADCIGYLIESDKRDQEFADDTNFYLAGTRENLDKTKEVVSIFSLAAGSQIKWDKSHAKWISNEQRSFGWGEDFEATLKNLKKKLSFWTTTKLSSANRILIANQVRLALVRYIALCWNLSHRTIKK